MGVTKTDYVRGMQCPKMLWLDKHKPEERVIPPEVQQRLDEGNEFGDKAMGMFGPFEEMTTIKPETGWLDYTAMINKTADALKRNVENICEASFSFYMNFCAVDILRKVEDGYEIYEVKNAPDVSEQFIKDVGFQRWILLKCGIKVVRCYIVYHGEDESNPFVIEDVTERAKGYWREVNDNIWRLGKLKKQEEEPEQPMGCQCDNPYECWYKGYCQKVAKE